MQIRQIAIAVGLIAATTTYAQEPIDHIITTIIENNTGLRAQSMTNDAVRLDMSDENALNNPEVELARVWGRHGVGNKLQLDVKQSFDWPGVYGSRSTAADMAGQTADMQFMAERLDLAQQARTLLVELVYVRKHIAADQTMRDNLRRMEEAIDRGLEGGELTILDKKKMEIEAYKMDIEIEGLVQRQNQIVHALQGMCATPLDLTAVTNYPLAEPLTRDAYLDNIANDPAVLAEALNAQSEDANARVARMSRFPSFSVGYQHQAEMGDRFNGFTVGMTLPVFQGRHARRAAMERSDAAQLNIEALTTAKTAEVDALLADIESSRRMMECYIKVFGDNKYMTLLDKAYRGGELNTLTYLQEVQYYHENVLSYLESEYQYNNALASLSRWQ